ncbi:tumor necrosis factor ligand superfamily member 9 [Sorex fumeus]|uniref:tumor necrosis factor ligand superfamily member 9 n=1 Tax=Sorex fumeus TaxID=62283 RepID=UPI0024AE17A6|nr:tumor necrosis factor ligand superfamily member 9 [Sorex fumeus]
MPNASAVQDPEAPHPAPPSRACTPLLWALGSALLLVAGSFAAFVAWWVLRAPDPRGATALEAPQLPPDPGARFSDPPQVRGNPRGSYPALPKPGEGALAPSSTPNSIGCRLRTLTFRGPSLSAFVFPQDLFGQLVAQNAQLSAGALSWHSAPGVARVLRARGVRYDAATRELEVARAGVYYVFVQLALRRVVAGGRAAGSVVAALRLRPAAPEASAPALTVDLSPPAASDSASAFRGVLLHLTAGQRLSLLLEPSVGLSPAWQLDQGATVLGLFCVAPDRAGGPDLQHPT